MLINPDILGEFWTLRASRAGLRIDSKRDVLGTCYNASVVP